MAYSYKLFKNEITGLLIAEFIKTEEVTGYALDVGAGEGTYWHYLKNHFVMDAVEVFAPNIEKYDLKSKYRNVYNENILDFDFTKNYYDVVIFGDIIEHLEVKDAQELISKIYNMFDEIMIAVPYKLSQGAIEDNIYEIHRQPDLTHEIFMERYPGFQLAFGNNRYGYYIKNR